MQEDNEIHPLCLIEIERVLCQHNLEAKQKKFHYTLPPLMHNGLAVTWIYPELL